jgi:hypothetical protein
MPILMMYLFPIFNLKPLTFNSFCAFVVFPNSKLKTIHDTKRTHKNRLASFSDRLDIDPSQFALDRVRGSSINHSIIIL